MQVISNAKRTTVKPMRANFNPMAASKAGSGAANVPLAHTLLSSTRQSLRARSWDQYTKARVSSLSGELSGV